MFCSFICRVKTMKSLRFALEIPNTSGLAVLTFVRMAEKSLLPQGK
jgi:hypothetical protein